MDRFREQSFTAHVEPGLKTLNVCIPLNRVIEAALFVNVGQRARYTATVRMDDAKVVVFDIDEAAYLQLSNHFGMR
jgi:hypothetical protein